MTNPSLARFVAGVCLLGASSSFAQTQVKPRVMLVVDTSGSMLQLMSSSTENAANNNGGDGSTSYTDGLMSRTLADTGFTLYQGFQRSTQPAPFPDCSPDGNEQYRGVDSRIYNAKVAVNNVLNSTGNIDWGLARYTNDVCPFMPTTITTMSAV